MIISRRTFTAVGLGLPTALALGACSSPDPGSATGPTTLRFAFWGNDLRVKSFAQVVALFEKANPDIKVTSEHADFSPYFERLAVQTAANEAPDVISMDFAYLREYTARGVLLPLSEHGIASDRFPKALLDTGTSDGQLFGLAHGMSAAALLASPAALNKAGVAAPDADGWTWDELIEFTADLTKRADGKIRGLGGRTFLQALAFQSFLAERSKSVFTAEGAVGFAAEDVIPWWELMTKAVSSGALAAPAKVVEESQTELDQSGLATGTVALDTFWSNQLTAINSTAGTDLSLLRFPTAAGAGDSAIVYQPTVYWTASSRTAVAEAAVKFINFFATDPAAAKIIMTDRGLPADENARAAIVPDLTPADQAAADYIGLDAAAGVAPFPPPPGGSAFGDMYTRATTDVLFGRKQPGAAAEALLGELSQAIQT